MAKIVKNAPYYLQKLSDLSLTLKKSYTELKDLVSSRRFIALTVEELCDKLSLEYTKKSFGEDVKAQYTAITKLLGVFDLKTVPCFIPCNLSFNDTIFITSKPDMHHDEDCAYVNDLLKKKIQPKPRDMVYISRMNAKLTNYNIMLRVFESLNVVSSEPLCAQQRMILNSILNDLLLPHEGADYLRTCYTYAAEQGNLKCDFEDKDYCFKPLKIEQELQVVKYLSQIAAQSSVLQTFNPKYPYINELNKAFLELKKKHDLGIEKYPAFSIYVKDDSSLSSLKPSATFSKLVPESTIKSRLNSVVNHLKKYQCTEEQIISRSNKLNSSISDILSNLSLPDWMAALILKKLATPDPLLVKSLPDFDKIRFFDLRKSINEGRDARIFYATSDQLISLAYPWIVRSSQDCPLDIIENPRNKDLKDYLINPNDKNSEQNLRLVNTLFFGLIVENMLKGYDKKRSDDLEVLLQSEFSREQYVLLFIRTLYFVLFKINLKEPKELKDLDILGLCCFPQLLRFLLYRIADFYKGDFNECPQPLALCFKLLLIRTFLDDSQLRSYVVQKPLNLIYVVKCAVMVGKNLATVDKYVETLSEIPGKNSSEFSIPLALSKPIKLLTDQIFEKNTLTPLFTFSEYREMAPYVFVPNRNLTEEYLNRLKLYTAHFDYLTTFTSEDNPLLINLLFNNLSESNKENIKQNLIGRDFVSDEEICKALSLKWSPELSRSLHLAILKEGLVEIPALTLLPKSLRKNFYKRNFVALTPLKDEINSDFLERLSALQFSYLLFYFILGQIDLIPRLDNFFELTEKQNKFVQEFFLKLPYYLKNSKILTIEDFQRLYSTERTNKYFNLSRDIIRYFGRDLIFKARLNLRITDRVKEIYSVFHLGDRDLLNHHDRYSLGEKISEYRKERPLNLSNLPSRPTYIKKVDFHNLDTSLIESKLQESAQVQDVIAKIKDENQDENTLVTDVDKTVHENFDATDITSNPTENGKEEKELNTKIELPSKQFYTLLFAIYTEDVEIMDLKEFEGLCLSAKFMSADAAVEILNDWSFEIFDEPIFELVPEEHSVYITKALFINIFN